tara:strand:- start:3015 stop:3215 length:201 start_codon:yes stop_codon:yes gene_type:complete
MAKKADSPTLLAITLKRSGIGCLPVQRLVLRGLGFRRLQQTVVCPDTPQVRGLIRKVNHLVEVQDV